MGDYVELPYRFMDDSFFRSAHPAANGYSIDAQSVGTASPYYYGDSIGANCFASATSDCYTSPTPVFPFPIDQAILMHNGGARYTTEELIRRTNLKVSPANGHLQSISHLQIHPMMCTGGYYPTGFSKPRRLYDFLDMEDGQLDRIMLTYELSRGNARYQRALRNDVLADRYGYGHSGPRRLAKLVAFFDYLGAYGLAEQLRRRGCDRSLDFRRPGTRVLDYCM